MDTLPLEPAPPRNPAIVLYQAWLHMTDWYGPSAFVGDRVHVQRTHSFEEDGGIILKNAKHYWHGGFITLYPNGSFEFVCRPIDRWDFWQRHTFMSVNWACRQRVLLVRDLETGRGENYDRGYENLNERDFKVRKPYLSPDAIVGNARYRLTRPDKYWLLDVDPRFHNPSAIRSLAQGYRFTQERYDRFERRAHRKKHGRPYSRLALKSKHTGLLTGQAAIEEMARHMVVDASNALEG